jgi:hypothetical protein
MQTDSSYRVGLTPPPFTCNADHLLELKSDLTLIEGLRRYKAKVTLRSRPCNREQMKTTMRRMIGRLCLSHFFYPASRRPQVSPEPRLPLRIRLPRPLLSVFRIPSHQFHEAADYARARCAWCVAFDAGAAEYYLPSCGRNADFGLRDDASGERLGNGPTRQGQQKKSAQSARTTAARAENMAGAQASG